VRGCSRRGLLPTTALQAVAAVAVLGMVQPAQAQLSASAQPAAGRVVAGQASIAQSAQQTTVTQTSQNAAVVTITTGGELFLSPGTAANGSILMGTSGNPGSGPVILSAPTVVMQAGTASAGGVGITLTDSVIGNGAGAETVADLSAASGGISQPVSGIIYAGTLQSSGGVAGTVAFAGTANSIGTIGSFAAASGDFDLIDTGTLGIAGPLAATNVTLSSATITATGTIAALGTVDLLSADAGGVSTGTMGSINAGGGISIGPNPGTIAVSGTIGGPVALSGGTIVVSGMTVMATGTTLASFGTIVALDAPILEAGTAVLLQPASIASGAATPLVAKPFSTFNGFKSMAGSPIPSGKAPVTAACASAVLPALLSAGAPAPPIGPSCLTL